MVKFIIESNMIYRNQNLRLLKQKVSILNKMIKQEPIQILHQDIQANLNNFQEEYNPIVKCVNGKEMIQLCFNKNCKLSNPSICFTTVACKCRQDHFSCPRISSKFIFQQMKKKQLHIEQLSLQVDNLFDEIIDKISQLRDKILVQIKSKLKYLNFDNVEKNIFEMLKGLDFQTELTGENLSQIFDNLYSVNQVKQKKNSFQSILLEYLLTFKTKFRIQLQHFENSFAKKVNKIYESNNLSQKSMGHFEIKTESSIIKNEDQIKNLLNFFPKKVKNLDIKFKASQHKFKLDKFYEICRKVSNTIIICLTNHDKIIGGYTPLTHVATGGWIKDQSETSFLFSLTNNDKFKLVKPQWTYLPEYVHENRKHFWMGGWGQLAIWDNNDSSSCCKTERICLTYHNEKYKDDSQSNVKLHGNSQNRFTLKQWEVYQVFFEDDQK